MKRGGELRLPTDVIVQVLSRVPEKSLARFNCVSKEWHSLISCAQPGSVKDLRRQRLRSNPYICIAKDSRRRLRLDGEDDGGDYPGTLRISIVDTVNERIKENYNRPNRVRDKNYWDIITCNDLLCFVDSTTHSTIHVCNVSIGFGEEVILPFSDRILDTTALGYSSRAADEYKYRFVQWFFDDNIEDEDLDQDFLVCQMFSLTDHLKFKSDSWQVVETIPHVNLCGNSVSVDGAIYKMIYENQHSQVGEEGIERHFDVDSILAFDLEKEKSEIISCPKLDPCAIASLVELKECLYLAHSWKGKAVVKMWKLNNTGDWVSGYHISFPFVCKTIRPLTMFLSEEDNVEKLVFLLEGKSLLYYDTETDSMRQPRNLMDLDLKMQDCCILRYI